MVVFISPERDDNDESEETPTISPLDQNETQVQDRVPSNEESGLALTGDHLEQNSSNVVQMASPSIILDGVTYYLKMTPLTNRWRLGLHKEEIVHKSLRFPDITEKIFREVEVSTLQLPASMDAARITYFEYISAIQLVEFRVRAWKGRRIYLTTGVGFALGLVLIGIFFHRSFVSLLYFFALLMMCLWSTDYLLHNEFIKLWADVKVIFAGFMPNVETTLSMSGWGAVYPHYKLQLKPNPLLLQA